MPIECRMCSDTSISRRGISREPCGSGSIRSLAGAAALKRRRPCEFRDHAAILTTTLCEKAVRHQAHQQRRQVPGTRPQRLRGMSTLPSTCQTCSCYLYMDVISDSPRRSIGSNGARSHLASCISRRCGVGGGGGRSCRRGSQSWCGVQGISTSAPNSIRVDSTLQNCAVSIKSGVG